MTVTTTPQQVRSTHDEWCDRRWRPVGGLVALLRVAFAVRWFVLGRPGPASFRRAAQLLR